jgi:ATP-dependent Lhr-like helicase
MSEKELQDRLPFPPARITAVLRKLRAEGRIVSGKLILGMEQEFFCDPENYRVLLRSAVAERRRSVSTISLDQYLQFSLNWHGVVEPCSSVEDLLRHYEGFALPPGFFEREILATRMRWSSAGEFSALLEHLEQQVASGQIIVRAMREENRIFLCFFRRGNGALLLDEPVIRERAASCSPAAVEIWKFLCSVGSCLIQDIQLGTGLSLTEIEKALHELLLAGVISCDSYPVFLSLCSGKLPPEETAEIAFGTRRINGDVRKRVRKIKRKIRERTHWRMRSSIARWFPLHSLPILGKITKSEDRSRPFLQARLLLQRYGVVVKEHHRRERGLLPWYPIFTALKRLEWQGEALRGYFVEGLSGVQFAAERAISGLEAAAQKRKSEPAFCLISSADPAFPYGGGIAWPVHLSVEKNLMRSPALHFLVGNGKIGALVQRFGMRIHFFEEDEETAAGCVAAMKRWLRLPEGVRPGRKLEVQEINGQPAAKWKLVHVFLRGGFEPHGERLILWPSRS